MSAARSSTRRTPGARRPRKKSFNVRFSQEEWHRLGAIARFNGITVANAARMLLRKEERAIANVSPPEGKILGMEIPHRMSSIGMLVLETDKGEVKITCDHHRTTEALVDCFGEVSVIGKKIWYRVDEADVLAEIGSVQ